MVRWTCFTRVFSFSKNGFLATWRLRTKKAQIHCLSDRCPGDDKNPLPCECVVVSKFAQPKYWL